MSYEYLIQQQWGEGDEEKAIVKKHENLLFNEADKRAKRLCGQLVNELRDAIPQDQANRVSTVAAHHLMLGLIQVCKEVEEDNKRKNAEEVNDLMDEHTRLERTVTEEHREYRKHMELQIKNAEKANSTLSSKIQKLEIQVKEANDKLEETTKRYHKREEDSDAIYAQSMEKEREERETLEKSLQTAQDDMKKLQDQYQDASSNYDRQVIETMEYKADKEKIEEVMKDIAGAQEEARQKCDDLEKALEAAETKVRKLEDAAGEPAAQSAKREAQLEDEIAAEKHKYEKLRSDNNDRIQQLNSRLKETEENVEKKKTAIKELREETLSLRKQLSDSRASGRASGSGSKASDSESKTSDTESRTSDTDSKTSDTDSKTSNKTSTNSSYETSTQTELKTCREEKEEAKRQLAKALEKLSGIEDELRLIQSEEEARRDERQEEIDGLNEELRQLGRKLMKYHDAVDAALTQYLGQFDAESEGRAEAAQNVVLHAFQEYVNGLLGRCQEQLDVSRAARDAGQEDGDGALQARIVGLEAELRTLRDGIAFTTRNTTMRETLLLNRRQHGLVDNPELDFFVPVEPEPQPGNPPPPGNPVQPIRPPPGGPGVPDLLRTVLSGQAGWPATAYLVGLFVLLATIIAEGRKYSLWVRANHDTRGMYAENRTYLCASLPQMSLFTELFVRMFKG